MRTKDQITKRVRILLEIDGIQTPILFHRHENGKACRVEDPQLTHHMNNVDDAVRDSLHNAGIEVGYE